MNDRGEYILELAGVTRTYQVGRVRLEVLRGVDWKVRRGEWACLLGASGSGKTTLLHLIGALEKPDAGSILVDGVEIVRLSRFRAAAFRGRKLGFVFQAYHLLAELSVLENVVLAARLQGIGKNAARDRAAALLDRVGLSGRLRHRPAELSGGEQQRVAIARALINDPELLLADGPTGNLDSRTGAEILELFRELRSEHPGRSIVMITHNSGIAGFADRVAQLEDGKLHES